MKTPEPIGQQGRWLDLLAEYDITIQHRPGRVHGNSDVLSRRPCERVGDSDCRQCRRPASGCVVESVSNADVQSGGGNPSDPPDTQYPPYVSDLPGEQYPPSAQDPPDAKYLPQ